MYFNLLICKLTCEIIKTQFCHMLKRLISIFIAAATLNVGNSVLAQTITDQPIEINITAEEKILLTNDYKTDEGFYQYNLTDKNSSKTTTISISANSINKYSLVEFCFEGIDNEPKWTTKSSATIATPTNETFVTIKAKSESGLVYQTQVKIENTRSFSAVYVIVIIAIILVVASAIYFRTRYKLVHTTLTLENELTDRKKEIFKLSSGKYIAPQVVETMLKQSDYIDNAFVFGADQKFASAVVVPDYNKLKAWAEAQGIKEESKEKLLENQKVNKFLNEIVASANAKLAAHENVKKVHFRFDEWTTDNGMLSQTLKFKRRNLQAFYAELIADTYRNA